jgi:hypothetical protein
LISFRKRQLHPFELREQLARSKIAGSQFACKVVSQPGHFDGRILIRLTASRSSALPDGFKPLIPVQFRVGGHQFSLEARRRTKTAAPFYIIVPEGDAMR